MSNYILLKMIATHFKNYRYLSREDFIKYAEDSKQENKK